MTEVSITPKRKRGKYRKLKIFGAIYISGIVAALVFLVYHWEFVERFQTYSYLGLFFVGLVTGFTLPVPIPYMMVVFTLGGVLHPALVGASCGLGLGIGGTLLHLTGRGGRKFFPMSSVFGFADTKNSSSDAPPPFIARLFRRFRIPRMIALAQRRGILTVFLMSAAINPFFAPMAVGLGALRFSLWKFFVACWAGQTVKCVGIAYAGYLGLGTILRWMEIL
jgi:membrane protein YqaA with SNARE-associated domain